MDEEPGWIHPCLTPHLCKDIIPIYLNLIFMACYLQFSPFLLMYSLFLGVTLWQCCEKVFLNRVLWYYLLFPALTRTGLCLVNVHLLCDGVLSVTKLCDWGTRGGLEFKSVGLLSHWICRLYTEAWLWPLISSCWVTGVSCVAVQCNLIAKSQFFLMDFPI